MTRTVRPSRHCGPTILGRPSFTKRRHVLKLCKFYWVALDMSSRRAFAYRLFSACSWSTPADASLGPVLVHVRKHRIRILALAPESVSQTGENSKNAVAKVLVH